MSPPPRFQPGLRGFHALCRAVGYPLAPFQRRIARAAFGPEREVGVSLPRGHGKSTLLALLALHHVLTVPDASVYIGAGAREQARIVGAIIRRYALHAALAGRLTVRHDELRLGDRRGPTVLRVVASDGGRALGWERPTLMLGDEIVIWNDREPSLLGSMTTSLVKNPTARLVLASTAPLARGSPWGRVRDRALALPAVHRDGPVTEASGRGLRWIEWSLPDDAEPGDLAAVKQANPAPWITRAMLAEQQPRCTELEWLAFHCNRSHVTAARWLPVGAWQQCAASYQVADDEPLVLGVDVGGARATTALVGCVADDDGVRVALVEVRTGKAAVLELAASVRELAEAGRPIAAVVYDPMRFEGEAQRLERDLGLTLVEWPQSPIRMTRCSENLHRLVTERRLRHAAHPTLDAHVANAIAQPTIRGWRLVKGAEQAHIDATIALAMAAEVAERRPEPARLLGWL
jgi:phage terminase large subunit-like protein